MLVRKPLAAINSPIRQLQLCHQIGKKTATTFTLKPNALWHNEIISLSDKIQIRQELDLNKQCEIGFGAIIWKAGIALSTCILDGAIDVEFWKDKRVLELGSGCGCVGLACAAVGAKSVVLTDLPPVLELLQSNVDLNKHVTNNVASATELDWNDISTSKHLLANVDVMLGADLIFVDPEEPIDSNLQCGPLRNMIETYFQVNGRGIVLMGLEERGNINMQELGGFLLPLMEKYAVNIVQCEPYFGLQTNCKSKTTTVLQAHC
eukprot:Platyproteum_vivax@DN6100_c0_g1_i1.p1